MTVRRVRPKSEWRRSERYVDSLSKITHVIWRGKAPRSISESFTLGFARCRCGHDLVTTSKNACPRVEQLYKTSKFLKFVQAGQKLVQEIQTFSNWEFVGSFRFVQNDDCVRPEPRKFSKCLRVVQNFGGFYSRTQKFPNMLSVVQNLDGICLKTEKLSKLLMCCPKFV